MTIFDAARAVSDAEGTLRAADAQAERMAGLLIGRLRKISAWRLKQLKRELREFNIQTGKWKEEA